MFDLNISSVTIKHQFTDTILVTYDCQYHRKSIIFSTCVRWYRRILCLDYDWAQKKYN